MTAKVRCCGFKLSWWVAGSLGLPVFLQSSFTISLHDNTFKNLLPRNIRVSPGNECVAEQEMVSPLYIVHLHIKHVCL